MNIYRTLLFAVIVSLLSQPLALMAQQKGDWAAVKSLGGGQEIRVEAKAGKKIDGTVSSVSDDGISISTGNGTQDVSYAEVKKVFTVVNRSKGPGVAIGAAIGAGVGAAIGGGALAATGGSDDTGGVIAPFIAVGAGLGALAGAFWKRKKRTLIYEAS
jgi:hypothetical protein